ncbi:MAG: hypothetical protein A3F74_26345 [Betaproteobacteria bacterium RIFCSPLOWO2_12_FULL_62_58]|nr:MAG: hypothetical protein A3F74_26345 [Betaproteobacteria bacterium RIFCSPLOWO2_12_FULL_62_58]
MRSAQNTGSRGVFGDMASLLKHLPHHQEPTALILLKGHLLVEELLRGYIDRKLPNPTAFKHDQFLFAKILMLCRALTPPNVKSWAFDAAKKLNDVRNEIAHELDSPKVKSKLENFISLVEQHAKKSVFPPKERGEARLYMAISDLHNELVHVLHAKES